MTAALKHLREHGFEYEICDPIWLAKVQRPIRSGRTFESAEPPHKLRLRTVSELFPEVMQGDLDGDALPSCSAAEALDRQEPSVNPTLANHALALLARLFRYGTISYHGAFVTRRRIPLRWSERLRSLGHLSSTTGLLRSGSVSLVTARQSSRQSFCIPSAIFHLRIDWRRNANECRRQSKHVDCHDAK
jgi:hypothetical protein